MKAEELTRKEIEVNEF